VGSSHWQAARLLAKRGSRNNAVGEPLIESWGQAGFGTATFVHGGQVTFLILPLHCAGEFGINVEIEEMFVCLGCPLKPRGSLWHPMQ